MSLTATVAELIEERGSGTADDLLPELEGYTRQRVIRALQNAKATGLLTCDGQVRRKGAGKGAGSKPGTYRPIAKAKPRPVASVWQLAEHCHVPA